MSDKSFGDVIWSSFLKSWGPVAAFVGLVVSIVVFFVTPAEDTVAIKWLVLVLVASFFLVVIFARAAWISYELSQPPNPEVIYAKEPSTSFSDYAALLVTKPVSLLKADALVSIYYLRDEVEHLVGIGRVFNIQQDGKVQILVASIAGAESTFDDIRKNSFDDLKRVVIKPVIPSFAYEELRNV